MCFSQVLQSLEMGNWRDTFGFKACAQENIKGGKEFEQLPSKEKQQGLESFVTSP